MLARVPKAFLSSDFIMPDIFESETGLTLIIKIISHC
jgi:hypothetical protein